jgi:hypothetical protein
MEYGLTHVLPLEAHLPDQLKFLLTRLRDIELMSTEIQGYHVGLDDRVSKLDSQISSRHSAWHPVLRSIYL